MATCTSSEEYSALSRDEQEDYDAQQKRRSEKAPGKWLVEVRKITARDIISETALTKTDYLKVIVGLPAYLHFNPRVCRAYCKVESLLNETCGLDEREASPKFNRMYARKGLHWSEPDQYEPRISQTDDYRSRCVRAGRELADIDPLMVMSNYGWSGSKYVVSLVWSSLMTGTVAAIRSRIAGVRYLGLTVAGAALGFNAWILCQRSQF